MTHLKFGMRRILSLAAFTTLIAAVTLAFAESPQGTRHATFASGEAAISISPTEAIRLAEAPAKKKRPPNIEKKPTTALSGALNLNIATALELTKLPGVGPKKAERIIQWRSDHGKFKRVVDLRRVKGFGAKSVKKLMPYLAISGKNSLR